LEHDQGIVVGLNGSGAANAGERPHGKAKQTLPHVFFSPLQMHLNTPAMGLLPPAGEVKRFTGASALSLFDCLLDELGDLDLIFGDSLLPQEDHDDSGDQQQGQQPHELESDFRLGGNSLINGVDFVVSGQLRLSEKGGQKLHLGASA
jgi:hypothetical protein